MFQKYNIHFINGIAAALVSIMAKVLGWRLEFSYGFFLTTTAYFILGFVISLLVSWTIKISRKKKPKNNHFQVIMGMITSIAILMFSTKLSNTISRELYTSSLFGGFILVFFVMIAPIIIFLWLNKIYINKIAQNKKMKKTMTYISYALIAYLILGFFFPLPFLFYLVRSQISIATILIIALILIVLLKHENGGAKNRKRKNERQKA